MFTLGGGICVTHSLRFTFGVTLADLLAASMAAEQISSIYLQAGTCHASEIFPFPLLGFDFLNGYMRNQNSAWVATLLIRQKYPEQKKKIDTSALNYKLNVSQLIRFIAKKGK